MPHLTTKQQLSETSIATIVSAFAGRNDVSIDNIMTLLSRLQSAEFDKGGDVKSRSQALPAAVFEQKMTADTIYCLCCGKGFKMLKRHLGAEHGLTEAEYRAMFNLPDDTPLVAPSYSKRKAEYAKRSGLGKYTRDKSEKNEEIS
jgi:predicted transcriptional regulator